ncbi:MAG: hypothetical protein Tp138OMZ00d2C19078261_65 [Prokaryotic dsDNA virus sp.]|jgi:uncharacterized protein (TIGR02217 family)|nr:MAG: hypothetical protein Tp138OMZ00d2C19078261_65 [Prokaryotic dsDNA virus sp.]|tara:strand:- start:12787 stop:13353 length:567 start_codon:yes stop_codon:yes gene_type:complete
MTDVIVLRSGFEQRNSLWANSLRQYNAGLGLRSMDDLYATLDFFEGRRGRLHGFRFKDWADYKSVSPLSTITNQDQLLGTGDGSVVSFQLRKQYDADENPWYRNITKPIEGSVVVALNFAAQVEDTDYTVDYTTGVITFATPPAAGVAVRAGFEFDVPCRFDQDEIMVNVELFSSGSVPDINIKEIRI